MTKPKPRPHCEICGAPIYSSNTIGVCKNGTPECRREYKRRVRRRRGIPARGEKRQRKSTRRVPAVPAGTVFGRWTTLEESPMGTRSKTPCRCECGTECARDAQRVKSGILRSCGCMRREINLQHGLSGHPLYPSYIDMIRRCENPADQEYHNYGGRGITVCERWRGMPDGLRNFIADMDPRPPGLQIDRLDNDGGYWCGRCGECVRLGRPANAAWRSRKEQSANRRSIRKLTEERDLLAAEVAELKRQRGDAA